MVSNCANPACGVPLRYLRDGRLFQFEVKALATLGGTNEEGSASRKRLSRQVWHFWLCGQCSVSMTLEFDGGKGLKIIPLEPPQPRYPAALPVQLAS